METMPAYLCDRKDTKCLYEDFVARIKKLEEFRTVMQSKGKQTNYDLFMDTVSNIILIPIEEYFVSKS